MAVFAALGGPAKLAGKDITFRCKTRQRRLDGRRGQRPALGWVRRDKWNVGACVAPQQGFKRVGAGVQENVR